GDDPGEPASRRSAGEGSREHQLGPEGTRRDPRDGPAHGRGTPSDPRGTRPRGHVHPIVAVHASIRPAPPGSYLRVRMAPLKLAAPRDGAVGATGAPDEMAGHISTDRPVAAGRIRAVFLDVDEEPAAETRVAERWADRLGVPPVTFLSAL